MRQVSEATAMNTGEHCHIRPEPIEAPEPQPVRPERREDKVRLNALIEGWREMTGEGPGLSSFASFKAGVTVYEQYMATWNRRAK